MRQVKKEFARSLRKEQTSAEEKVWKLLRNRKFRNLKFRRQHVIEGFVIDFFCNEHKLAIEIDGGIHKKKKDYDELRQDIIESEDITLIRITNDEMAQDEESVLKKIKEVLEPSLPSPLPLGEGRKDLSKLETSTG